MDANGSALVSLGLSLALLQTSRKFLQTATRVPRWDAVLEKAKFGAIAFFSLAFFGPLAPLVTVGWVALLGLINYTAYLVASEYRPARILVWALLPISVVYPFVKLVKAIAPRFVKTYDSYFSAALVFSGIWLFVLWRMAVSQRKALEKERLEREAEARKIKEENSQLEHLVAERTAELTRQKEELEQALVELKTTQTQLIQAEKMASLGELTAGIAHEIQNPLNFVNNFSEVSVELLNELDAERQSPSPDPALEAELLADLAQNLQKISHHGSRASSIVRGMLEHSRASTGERRPTDLNALADEYLRLAYHGLRAKDKSFNASLNTDFDASLGPVSVVAQDLGRVLLNLMTNAFYAVAERAKTAPPGYQPTVSVGSRCRDGKAELWVRDNGTGIPEAAKKKIFQPFFTTKPSGSGTGLGLSLAYDIVTKGHGGTLSVTSQEGEGSEFVVCLPA